MAGSFDIFRKYQRSMLAAVAILAMLAFFVLPPFLQMSPDAGVADPLVATWRDGGIREGELQRAVAMRMVLNQFLRDSIAASGRDPGTMQVLGDDEEDVVRTLLLAREAEANGIVIGNGAVNQFLAQWTENRVRPGQFEALIAGLRLGQTSVAPAEVFEALRTVLAADRMRQLSFAGFAGDPPAARWENFRRLEQEATVEVVPVVVESLSGDVPAPPEGALRAFFDRFKDSLPVDRSPDPGFKEPHRISYDWIAANLTDLEAAALKDVTDAEIEKFYEENKVRLYREKPAAEETKPATADTEPAAKEATPAADQTTPAAESAAPATTPADAAPAESGQPSGATEPAKEPKASSVPGRRFMPVKFRQQPKAEDAAPPADAPGTPAAGPPAADGKPAGGQPATDAKPAAADKPADGKADDVAGAEKPAEGKPAGEEKPAETADAAGIQPLEKVRDDVRKRLAAAAVSSRLDDLFRAVTADVVGFSRDLSRWKAESGDAGSKPAPPSVEAIAEKQGLKAGHGERQTAGEAQRAGGVGTSFQLSLDPRSPMGFRQAQWAEIFFGPQRPLWRPVETRDVPGNRYLTWKTDDAPTFAPEFEAVRADVERAWRIVEARPLARRVAEEIAAGATGGRTLAAVAAGRSGPKLEAATVGPFTWLARDSAAFGAPPSVSRPEGLEMPGEDFMRAVFALEPGGTAVAFNEPRTICYAIRLVGYQPAAEELQRRFLDPTADQRRLGAVAEQEQGRAFEAWLTGVEKRAGLEWKRPPQPR